MKFTIVFIAITMAQAARVDIKNVIQKDVFAEDSHQGGQQMPHEAEESRVEGCGPTTCTTFTVDKTKCSCNEFKEDPQLAERMLQVLEDTMQRLRKVSDKLTKDSGTLRKWWWGNSIGKAREDLKLLNEGMEHLPVLEQYMSTKPSASGSWKPPAGVFPITVEVWDHNSLSQNIFIGETGVSLEKGLLRRNKVPLQLNKHQTNSWVQPENGKVSFETNLVESEPFDCDIQGMKRCVRMKLNARCIEANDLPNTDTWSLTDAYCKIRVKKDPMTPAVTFKTKVVNNFLDPVFEPDTSIPNHISSTPLEWDVPIIPPVPTNKEGLADPAPEKEWVLWVSDELVIGEQMENQVLYLATNVFLDAENRCKDKSVEEACEMIDALSDESVDPADLQDMRNQTRKADSSLMQLHIHGETKTYGFRANAAAVSASRRNRARKRGGGYRYGGGGGGRHGGGGCGVCMLVLFVVLMIVLL